MSVAAEDRTAHRERWPALPLDAWRDTYETFHLYTQVVGKIPLALCPHVNHWWQVGFTVTPRGLITSSIPTGDRTFEIEFDLIDHNLVFRTSDAHTRELALIPRTVADFYRNVVGILKSLGIPVPIRPMPAEIADAIPLDTDTRHAAYDAESAHRFWEILREVDTVLKVFRARFVGKSSPVLFYWGTCDLAVSRYSGRPATPPRTDSITREAHNREVCSVGFWPGGGAINGPAFYSYVVPQPPNYSAQTVKPSSAFYSQQLGEFVLMYDDVRRAEHPDQLILDFAQSTYEAAANLASWDRGLLERVTVG